ncbi:MAG TPA: M1 family metallopeptidase [Acidimicrobiales bacterium]|nr:M1 family metallopeptidase [Acidimicrobiales bacterium]
MPADAPYRLPRTVEPRRYELTLTPDLADSSFAGEERVELVVHEPTAEIVLNALDLDILSAELVAEDGRGVAGTVTLDTENERAVVALDGPVDPGTWFLHLTFTGAINDRLRGWYRSTYAADDGTEHVIAATQLEPTDARRVFPCWDEPDRKAVFSVTLIVDEGLTAVSNGAVVEDSDLGNGKRQVRFADTMPMSTYLVAVVVGRLAATAPQDAAGTPVRAVCRPGTEHLTGFAVEVTGHSLRFFAEYFDVPYPADKLDLIALPDFAMGAMENLGAVTFRETLLLTDTATASRVELERIADVVAHEVAHMWFGDLVTMRWWNGIWLNEAFATFMELLCVDAFRPEWHRWVTFGTTRGAALSIDALASTRPVEFPVARPSEAEEMFDPLTYQKGAGVLRMLEQYLGPDAFRRGIARYIARHSYGNTETTDLWDALEEASGEPARATMDSWILQGGHPVVAVAAADDGVVLSQERFRFAGEATDETRWRVPVLLRAGVGGEVVHRRLLLDEESATVPLGGRPDWVVVNEGGWGVYRVQYDPVLFRGLLDGLGGLDALERYTLADDTWALVLAGRASLDDFLDLARLLAADEDNPNVWSVLLGGLDLLERSLPSEDKEEVRSLVATLCRPVLERLGWAAEPGEPETRRTLRAQLIRALGVLAADPEVRERAAEVVEALGRDVTAVDPDVASAAVAVAAHAGGEAEYAEYLRRWRGAATPQEEQRYLYALAGFEDVALVRRTLNLSLEEVRSQNGPFLVSLLLANRAGGAEAWAFLEARWDDVLARFPEPLVDRMLDGILVHNTPEAAARIRAFLEAHPVPGRARQVQQLLERLDVYAAFRLRATGGRTTSAATPAPASASRGSPRR